MTSNLDDALAFYRDRLGHPLVWRTSEVAGLKLPDSDAELGSRPVTAAWKSISWSHPRMRRRRHLKKRVEPSSSRPSMSRSTAAW